LFDFTLTLWCTRLAAASDKVYQLLAHGRWFSPGTPASSTTKTGRHEIAESGVKHQKSNQIIYRFYEISGVHSLGSPQWGENGEENDFSLPRFLYGCRTLLRSAFAVMMITVPSHLFHVRNGISGIMVSVQ
jgi:hypothetical protein